MFALQRMLEKPHHNSKENNDDNCKKSQQPQKALKPKERLLLSHLKGFNDDGVRTRRLMKEFAELQRTYNNKSDPLFTVELINDNLYEWYVRLFSIDPESNLAKDMEKYKIPYILLHLEFPNNFPFSPPFMRIVTPHIRKGFVLKGGAICMELLTPRGWASAYTIEAVIIQFSASVVKGNGRIDINANNTKELTKKEAEESFRYLVRAHEKYGWLTPALSDG